jgi:hypothetical protein
MRRPTDMKPKKKGGPFQYLVYGVIIVIFGSMISVVLYVGTTVTGSPLWTGIFPGARSRSKGRHHRNQNYPARPRHPPSISDIPFY